jgi:hypothetical protein
LIASLGAKERPSIDASPPIALFRTPFPLPLSYVESHGKKTLDEFNFGVIVNYVTIQQANEVTMQNQLLHAALLAIATAGTGSMVAALSHGHDSTVPSSSVAPVTSAATGIMDGITLLPVITVTAKAPSVADDVMDEITLLPVITVTAKAPSVADDIMDGITLLPTITVTAQASIPVLPVITVRPARTDLDGLKNHPASAPVAYDAHGNIDSFSNTAFQMPYYSFGQPLGRTARQTGKE